MLRSPMNFAIELTLINEIYVDNKKKSCIEMSHLKKEFTILFFCKHVKNSTHIRAEKYINMIRFQTQNLTTKVSFNTMNSSEHKSVILVDTKNKL
jgi:hypothetical protein